MPPACRHARLAAHWPAVPPRSWRRCTARGGWTVLPSTRRTAAASGVRGRARRLGRVGGIQASPPGKRPLVLGSAPCALFQPRQSAGSAGNDFRPDYKKLGVLKQQFPDAPLLALTATATEQVGALQATDVANACTAASPSQPRTRPPTCLPAYCLPADRSAPTCAPSCASTAASSSSPPSTAPT